MKLTIRWELFLMTVTNPSALFDSSLSKVIVQSLIAALARPAGGFNSSSLTF